MISAEPPFSVTAFVVNSDHHSIRIGDEREQLVTNLPVITKSWGPSWEEQLPGERPRETTESCTQALSPDDRRANRTRL
jgi:hypothetical protein